MAEKKDAFPIRFFVLYVLFYSGQAIYGTYLNLYLSDMGITISQLGLITSVSTVFTLGSQAVFGIISDRVPTKNAVLLTLYALSAVILMLFYAGTQFWLVMLLVMLFNMVFHPIIPLQDNLVLESMENRKWDFGQIRMGGTIGYCVTVLLAGIVLQDQYRNIFWASAIMLTLCLVAASRLPKVAGYREGKGKTPYRALLGNKALLVLIAFHLCYSLGSNLYYSFYAIHFKQNLGGNSGMIGVMTFIAAVSEIPILFFINKIIRKIGIGTTLIAAALASSIRWFCLFLLTDPALILLTNLLHGMGFIGFSYSLVTYINNTVPKDLRATSQSFNALITSIFTRVLFGYVGGLASEAFGIANMMLVSCAVILIGTVTFALWLKFGQNAVSIRKNGGAT